MSLLLIFLGATIGIAGSFVQYRANQDLQFRISHSYDRDAERLRQMGTFAFELGHYAVSFFALFDDKVRDRPYPHGDPSWVRMDFEGGVKDRHKVFGIDYAVPSFDELVRLFHETDSKDDPFDVPYNIYGSNDYVYEVGSQIWAKDPSTTVSSWFHLSSEIGQIAHLMKHEIYIPIDDPNDRVQRLIRIGQSVGVPPDPFDRWAADLRTLQGDDFDIRTYALLGELEQYKRMVWDPNPFAPPRRWTDPDS